MTTPELNSSKFTYSNTLSLQIRKKGPFLSFDKQEIPGSHRVSRFHYCLAFNTKQVLLSRSIFWIDLFHARTDCVLLMHARAFSCFLPPAVSFCHLVYDCGRLLSIVACRLTELHNSGNTVICVRSTLKFFFFFL